MKRSGSDRRALHCRRQPRGFVTSPQRQRGHTRGNRSGVETLELILAFPILFIATLAIFQFAILVIIQQTITTAATEGARAAAAGATTDQVAARVLEFLDIHQITFTTTANDTSGNARVRVENGGVTNETRGNTNITCDPDGPTLSSDEVRVSVCVTATTDDQPVPDWLSSFGFSIAGRTFHVSALAKIE